MVWNLREQWAHLVLLRHPYGTWENWCWIFRKPRAKFNGLHDFIWFPFALGKIPASFELAEEVRTAKRAPKEASGMRGGGDTHRLGRSSNHRTIKWEQPLESQLPMAPSPRAPPPAIVAVPIRVMGTTYWQISGQSPALLLSWSTWHCWLSPPWNTVLSRIPYHHTQETFPFASFAGPSLRACKYWSFPQLCFFSFFPPELILSGPLMTLMHTFSPELFLRPDSYFHFSS